MTASISDFVEASLEEWPEKISSPIVYVDGGYGKYFATNLSEIYDGIEAKVIGDDSEFPKRIIHKSIFMVFLSILRITNVIYKCDIRISSIYICLLKNLMESNLTEDLGYNDADRKNRDIFVNQLKQSLEEVNILDG